MISDVRRIQALLQVAERGTITAAAEALGYTPSAVSQQLSALEAELGVPVLERRGRNVVVTDAGRLLIDHGQDAVAALERAMAAVAELQDEPAGRVRIGSLASAAGAIIPIALQTLRAEYPLVEPELVVHPLARNVEELRLGAVDIAVDQLYGFAPHNRFEGLDETVLLDEPHLLLSPASAPVTSVPDARDLDWVVGHPTTACGRSARAAAAEHGFSPRSRYETEDYAAILRLVGAGLAVAVVPSLAMAHRPEDVHVEVIPGLQRRISALTRPASSSRPAIVATIGHLHAAATGFVREALAAA